MYMQLLVYTAEDVSNELERAKVEYLESWVRVAGRRQLAVLPRLLHWHMRHFADDAASLLEWVHTQLPRGPLKRAVRRSSPTSSSSRSSPMTQTSATCCRPSSDDPIDDLFRFRSCVGVTLFVCGITLFRLLLLCLTMFLR
jgi:hypothetical protein